MITTPWLIQLFQQNWQVAFSVSVAISLSILAIGKVSSQAFKDNLHLCVKGEYIEGWIGVFCRIFDCSFMALKIWRRY